MNPVGREEDWKFVLIGWTLIRLIELVFTDFIVTDGMENDGGMEERLD